MNHELYIDESIRERVQAKREEIGYTPPRLASHERITNLTRVEKRVDRVQEIADELGSVVFGQDQACLALARHVAIAEAGWSDPKRPKCSVLFLGPTGTGKTEMAKALGQYMFGDAQSDRLKMVRMQEYMTPDKISKLTGVAPGFAGSDEEPEIPHAWLHEEEEIIDPETGKVTQKMKPSIIVLDEFEKAHPDVRKAFLSALDEGTMNARVGKTENEDEPNGTKPLNFRNTFFILTSNIGSDKMKLGHTAREIETIGREAVRKQFKDMPEFLGRLTDTVAFMHLSTREYRRIFDKLLAKRINERQEADPDTAPKSFNVSEELRQYFLDNVNPELGGRSLRNAMDQTLFTEAAQSVAGMTGDIYATLEDGKVVFYTDEGRQAPEDTPPAKPTSSARSQSKRKVDQAPASEARAVDQDARTNEEPPYVDDEDDGELPDPADPDYPAPNSKKSASPARKPTSKEAQEKEKLYRREQAAWEQALGTRVDIKPLPSFVTPDVQRNLERAGLALRYIPDLKLDKRKLESEGADEYIESLEGQYPKWRAYEGLNSSEQSDHSVSRNMRQWFWEQAENGNVDFPELPGQWVAVETVDKPRYGAKYDRTPIGEKLGFKRENRFGTSYDTITQKMADKKADILRDMGISGRADVRLLETAEWNLLANREGWGKTDTYEWTNTEYRDSGYSVRLVAGYSGGGGAANVNWSDPSYEHGRIGWRAAVVLG